jgi:tellurium resistance protein TerD
LKPNDNGLLIHKSGAVRHSGDNLTGAGKADSDKEIITIKLDKVPAQIDRIVNTINIYKAEERKENFGMVSGAYCRVVDASTGTELMRLDLSENRSTVNTVVVGEVYRDKENPNEWKFHAIGDGLNAHDIEKIAEKYGYKP